MVLGSGIEAAGFSSADETVLRQADYVFFCVADPATEVWIKTLRPDAYDLYVFYGENKKRYITYMEMTEAILHYVRQGETVAAVYYGHPGVFVLSTHRAIQIARREGHRAVMRPAVSALDALSADLGIDPSQPGLQTFEATDMLIRQRRLDTSIHVVLWQVGLIGELGYRRQGFLNQGFGLLLDYLESFYGQDHPVLHYIGSRYPGVDPVIDRQTIASLRQPAIQGAVTGISTFYLPPKDIAPVDKETLLNLGLIRPGQTPNTPASPLRVIDRYGPREMKAYDDLAAFKVPESYHWQEDTAAARFVLALRDDPGLCRQYRSDPDGTVASWGGSRLGAAERKLLAKREGGAVQIAAKGQDVGSHRDIDRLLSRLLVRKSEARDLLRTVRQAAPGERDRALAAWSQAKGLAVDWRKIPHELDRFAQRFLIPWTGLYISKDRQRSVLVVAQSVSSGRDQVWLDGEAVRGVRYTGGVIRWRAPDGNTTNGYLHTDMSSGGRRLIGSIWPAGQAATSEDRFVAASQPLASSGAVPDPRPSVSGSYLVRVGPFPSALVTPFVLGGDTLSIDGVATDSVTQEGATWRWWEGPEHLAEGEVTAVIDPITGHPMLFGSLRGPASAPPRALTGMIPISPNELGPLGRSPRLGIPAIAWTHLVGVAAQASNQGGLLLWPSWHASVLCLRMLRAAVRESRA